MKNKYLTIEKILIEYIYFLNIILYYSLIINRFLNYLKIIIVIN